LSSRASGGEAPRANASRRKVVFASFIGTAIEFFDFGIFSAASALVFNEVFFTSLDPLAGTLASFATFGVAFFIRPVGAAIFGHFGDRLGRKTMLALSLGLMGTATTMVGLLPTYAAIGIWAPVLLVVSRLLQGLAVSGEWSGAVLMGMEHAPPKQRAFYAMWPQRGVPAGWLLATGSFFLVGLLPQDQMLSWGWRIPFLASSILVAVGMYVRLQLPESPAFEAVREREGVARYPVAEVLRTSKKSLLTAVCAMGANSVVFYMTAVFALSYGVKEAGASRNTMLLAVATGLLLQIFTIPIVAKIADRHGRRPVLLAGSVLSALLAFPLFWLIDTGSPPAIILAMVLALSVVHALTGAPIAIFLPELFEPRVRYSGSAMGYHIGAMVMSGPVPFASAALFRWAGAPWILSLYILAGAALTFVAVLFARETVNTTYTDRRPLAASVGTLRSTSQGDGSHAGATVVTAAGPSSEAAPTTP
jgi:MFS family permease